MFFLALGGFVGVLFGALLGRRGGIFERLERTWGHLGTLVNRFRALLGRRGRKLPKACGSSPNVTQTGGTV